MENLIKELENKWFERSFGTTRIFSESDGIGQTGVFSFYFKNIPLIETVLIDFSNKPENKGLELDFCKFNSIFKIIVSHKNDEKFN
jgi:hypothetical protein